MKVSMGTIRINPIAVFNALDEGDYTDEILNNIKLLASQFTSLSQSKIAKIFANKFPPMKIYKLHYMKKCDDIYQDKISIKKKTFKIKKVITSYKSYGQNNFFYLEVFLNYTIFVKKLFDITISSLHFALY